jgi:twitching motility protein PilT
VELNEILKIALKGGASDIHLKIGLPPMFRLDGALVPLKNGERLTLEEIQEMSSQIMNPVQQQRFEETREVDLAYGIAGLGRFRVNAFQQRGSIGIVFRVIPFGVKTLESLHLPKVISNIAMEQRGLVLVTGTTGSGKSTTLAAMIEHINANRTCHIMTIEDPIEFLIRDRRSIVNQREIGVDTLSFSSALRAALRQDPDVIMVGEMRDLETVDMSLKAAETGHLVFSSIHTSDVSSTINRLVSFFPAEEQGNVRQRLADNLKAVVSLRLLPNKKGTARVPAVEIMRSTRTIQECIKDPSKTNEINEFIARGRSEGNQTFDQHLLDLIRASKVSVETAIGAATNPMDLKTKLSLEGGDPDTVDESEPVQGPFEIESDTRF